MDNTQLTDTAIKLITLMKHISTLWYSSNVKSQLKRETIIKLRNFYTEVPLVLAEIAMLLKHPKLIEEHTIENLIADVTQLRTSAITVVDDIKSLYSKD